MAQTLEEFLISVKYNIDQPSQDTFFNAMKRAATSVAGVAGELTGLGIAVLKISEIMATAGEKLYWMSQRVGDSVTEIQGMAFAMSNLGISAGEATAGIERFGAWTRSMGPAATGYLHSLGVTATDTIGRMQQLGDYFRTHGGTFAQQGSLEYALTLRRWQMMGGDERSMLALSNGQMQQNLQQAGLMQRLVWGKDWQTGPQQFAAQSVAIMNQFRLMGFFFENLKDKFALGLFNAIEQPLKDINAQLQALLPDIEKFLDHIISYAPAALHFLQGVMKAFGEMISLASSAMEFFDQLPHSFQIMLGALLALPMALRLVSSPLFRLMAGFTALLYLIDDYQHFIKDPNTASINWDKISQIFKPMTDAVKGMDDWIEKWTGVKNAIEWITGIGLVGIVTGFGPVIAAATALAAVFWGPLGILAGVGLAAAGIHLAGMLETQLRNEAKAAGYEIIPGDPSVGAPDTFKDPTGKEISSDEMARRLGHKKGFISPDEMTPHLSEPYTVETEQEYKDRQPHMPSDVRKGFTDPVPPAPWNLGIGDALKNLFHHFWHGGGGANGPESPTPGDPNARGLIPAAFRVGRDDGDEFFTPERFYALFLFGFQTMTEKLGDILKTLTDMAEGQGAPHTARGGGDDSDVDLLPPGASTDAQEAKLREIERRESGGQNILNRQGPGGSPASSASGFYQMIDGTWLHAARLAGIDTNRYPRAIDAPHDVQHRAALALMNEQGERPWISSAPHLGHVPLGGGAATGGVAGGGAARGASGGVHNQTTIHMTAPNPASAAAQVVEAQNRVFEHHIRFAKGALLA
jgi:hypothetical protein